MLHDCACSFLSASYGYDLAQFIMHPWMPVNIISWSKPSPSLFRRFHIFQLVQFFSDQLNIIYLFQYPEYYKKVLLLQMYLMH
jgi:hypothetical protein